MSAHFTVTFTMSHGWPEARPVVCLSYHAVVQLLCSLLCHALVLDLAHFTVTFTTQ